MGNKNGYKGKEEGSITHTAIGPEIVPPSEKETVPESTPFVKDPPSFDSLRASSTARAA